MKVNNSGVKPAQTTTVAAKNLEKDALLSDKLKSNSKPGVLDSSKVEMSPQAQAFQKAKAIASKDSIDEAKVARLQKLIDEGKYKVDAAAVADRLVDDHLQVGE